MVRNVVNLASIMGTPGSKNLAESILGYTIIFDSCVPPDGFVVNKETSSYDEELTAKNGALKNCIQGAPSQKLFFR